MSVTNTESMQEIAVTIDDEIQAGDRFEFGKNWGEYLQQFDAERLATATRSLQHLLGVERLDEKRFLDLGSGSGLFSLAARTLGANVVSIDYDPASVGCTEQLRRLQFPDDTQWKISRASALDEKELKSLGQFEVVYSWGVLHHTGDMWRGLKNVVPLVTDRGKLVVAIYNHQGFSTKLWTALKWSYNALPKPLRFLVVWPAFVRIWGPPLLRDLMQGTPGRSWRNYDQHGRGMSPWHDLIDWVGGWPFEAATREQIIDFYSSYGFTLEKLISVESGSGCNQFVFSRSA